MITYAEVAGRRQILERRGGREFWTEQSGPGSIVYRLTPINDTTNLPDIFQKPTKPLNGNGNQLTDVAEGPTATADIHTEVMRLLEQNTSQLLLPSGCETQPNIVVSDEP